ncbi:MAG: maleylpyruvate isomerase family mycothiol-dependent enzyme [Ilumatobacter sp.]|nr:maleylpyruvate isomerase family mycothiol-dependent enzyme [Ilumatobacter sp.]MCB0984275.1 maleylpyruvate isomerase family mycothiol-dependent enzyme [Ilumatobacter sp.]
MQLAPRYGTDQPLTMDGDPAAIGAPTLRQRRRVAGLLAGLTDDQWATPSRCEGWTVRDVMVHLESTNGFWAFALSAGLQGEPSRFLTTFDPVATPAQMVAATAPGPGAEVAATFAASVDALAGVIASLDATEGGWAILAEAPPGHITAGAVTHHALWDSWVHERDILLPLGIAPAVEADEVAACLRYAAALGPALARNAGSTRTGAFTVSATGPDVEFTVRIGSERVHVGAGVDADADLHLRGDAVELLEAFSVRAPFPVEVPAAHAWMMHGLAETFDAPPLD